MNLDMKRIGWNAEREQHMHEYRERGLTMGRVAEEHKRMYRVWTEHGTLLAEVTGKLRYAATERQDYPAVGDWVAIGVRPREGKATIHAILPRTSKFSRKTAGNVTEEQIVATNIDTVFIVNALNQDFNLRRMERYLVMAWESGANPVIVLSKMDVCDDVEARVRETESVAVGVPIIPISAMDGRGIERLAAYLKEGQTAALLGSSGVGKSSLANKLAGQDLQAVQDIREDDGKGKHTTTYRQMIVLPDGGVLIDTPGMRELQLWEADESLDASFRDIEELAENCRFADCRHRSEPGCAVRRAIEEGELARERLASYEKLQRELYYLEIKNDKRAQSELRKNWKKVTANIVNRPR